MVHTWALVVQPVEVLLFPLCLSSERLFLPLDPAEEVPAGCSGVRVSAHPEEEGLRRQEDRASSAGEAHRREGQVWRLGREVGVRVRDRVGREVSWEVRRRGQCGLWRDLKCNIHLLCRLV